MIINAKVFPKSKMNLIE